MSSQFCVKSKEARARADKWYGKHLWSTAHGDLDGPEKNGYTAAKRIHHFSTATLLNTGLTLRRDHDE